MKLIAKKFFLVCLAFSSCFLDAGASFSWEQDLSSLTVGNDGKLDSEGRGVINGGATWREPSENDGDSNSSLSVTRSDSVKSSNELIGPKTTRFSYELNQLPNQDGQFWVVYDLTPFTDRFSPTAEPQKSIVEWIRFDSGKDFWHKEPFCILSASRERLYVYHNADVQRYVSNIVDRFVDPTKSGFSFTIRAIAVQSPEWRLRAAPYLTPTSVALEGNGADVQGWIVERDYMSKIISDLEKRSDYIELNDPKNKVPNGRTFGWAAAAPRKSFARDYRADSEAASGYMADVSNVDEGFRIETTPLLSTSGETLEVTFRYSATVVEKMRTFNMRVPTAVAPRQQLEVERPQIVSCDVSGRIALPRSKGVIVDLGMTPLAGVKKENEPKGALTESVSGIVGSKSAFYDVLIIVNGADDE
ncbi:MAG: hypothetical protein J6X44_06825 [Thermoguttaceae bacterium]|nr:hypothetical protein [Thermoguttaceae bacterium]